MTSAYLDGRREDLTGLAGRQAADTVDQAGCRGKHIGRVRSSGIDLRPETDGRGEGDCLHVRLRFSHRTVDDSQVGHTPPS